MRPSGHSHVLRGVSSIRALSKMSGKPSLALRRATVSLSLRDQLSINRSQPAVRSSSATRASHWMLTRPVKVPIASMSVIEKQTRGFAFMWAIFEESSLALAYSKVVS